MEEWVGTFDTAKKTMDEVLTRSSLKSTEGAKLATN